MAKVKGFDKLIKDLKGLDKKLAKKAIRTALRQGAKTFASEVRDRAPVDTGALRRTVKVRAGKGRKGFISMRVIVPGGHEGTVTQFVEFGTAKARAQPFIRPAFEARKEDVADQIIDDLAAAVEEALKG